MTLAVVVPAHDEEACLGECLAAIGVAAEHPALLREPVICIVVLDACTDGSARIAHAAGVLSLFTDARNVGVARGLGAQHALELGAAWIAFTDADSRVAPDWLVRQCELRADAVCGTVQIADWSGLPAAARERYAVHYQDRDDHRHVHGANLGVSASAYRRAGGMPPLPVSEDVAFVQRLIALDCRIAWSALPRVITSARIANRVQGGFSGFLRTLAPDGG